MNSGIFFALALTVRVLPSVDGVVECRLAPGESLIDAYSAEFEPVWGHTVPTTVVDRVEAARAGKVTGLGPSDRLVLAIADERAAFDVTRPVEKAVDVFPYSPRLVTAYAKLTGRDYVRDMMVVVAPKLGSQIERTYAVIDLYETLFSLEGAKAAPKREFGAGGKDSVLIVTSRPRIWSWLDRCFGDDGTAYAEKLAAKGFRVTLADASALERTSVDAAGFAVLDGRRYETVVLRHLAVRDGDRCRRVFGNRRLATKVYATDAPVLHGVEITWTDPDLD